MFGEKPDWPSSARQTEHPPHKGSRNANCCSLVIGCTWSRFDRLLLSGAVWLFLCHRPAVRPATDVLQRTSDRTAADRPSTAGCSLADGRLRAGRLAALLPLPVPVSQLVRRQEVKIRHDFCSLTCDL